MKVVYFNMLESYDVVSGLVSARVRNLRAAKWELHGRSKKPEDEVRPPNKLSVLSQAQTITEHRRLNNVFRLERVWIGVINGSA